MVFQNYALFPHLTVGSNVEYGLKVRKIPAAERRESWSSFSIIDEIFSEFYIVRSYKTLKSKYKINKCFFYFNIIKINIFFVKNVNFLWMTSDVFIILKSNNLDIIGLLIFLSKK